MTAEEFLTEYPEFENVDEEYIVAKLARATQDITEEAFGEDVDDAQGIWTAHLLWSSPAGATMRLDSKGKEMDDPYLAQWRAAGFAFIDSFVVVTS